MTQSGFCIAGNPKSHGGLKITRAVGILHKDSADEQFQVVLVAYLEEFSGIQIGIKLIIFIMNFNVLKLKYKVK